MATIAVDQPDGTKLIRRMTAEEMLARAAELVVADARISAEGLARKLGIPSSHALKIKDLVFERVFQGIETRYTPDTLVSMKAELTQALVSEIESCREKGEDNPRAYVHMNTAIKILSGMHGFNAPVQIETTDRKLYSLVNPAVHARIMADPHARAALLQLEEFASAQEGAIDVEIVETTAAEGGGE